MAKQLGQKTDAVQLGIVGNRAACHLDQGGQEIGGIDEILVHSLRDFSSPTNHQWHVGSGIGRSPFATHDGTREGFGGDLLVRAIVTEKKDHRIFVQAKVVDMVDDPAHTFVHVLDHVRKITNVFVRDAGSFGPV